MIYFDTTKTGRAGHRSGLNRVSACLREAFGGQVSEVVWSDGLRQQSNAKGVPLRTDDWFLTSELFSAAERPGFPAFLASRACRTAAIFHDAIPLKHPHITWPQSVARHPGYMKLLARFDRIWAVSAASRDELLGFWQWQGIETTPPIEVLALGSDFNGAQRVIKRTATTPPSLVCLGILEPRKNQSFLLDVCTDLWAGGHAFELHVIGRVNPHFGKPIVSQLKTLQRRWRKFLHVHGAARDEAVATRYAHARASVFPTIAEGCGLPLLESLWMGVPCVCSDLPVLRENADGGGCLPVAVNDRTAWKDALRRLLTDDSLLQKLTTEATTRPLPTWNAAAQGLAASLRDWPG